MSAIKIELGDGRCMLPPFQCTCVPADFGTRLFYGQTVAIALIWTCISRFAFRVEFDWLAA
jgi:hypothetical protein